jgi:hypothetical protein
VEPGTRSDESRSESKCALDWVPYVYDTAAANPRQTPPTRTLARARMYAALTRDAMRCDAMEEPAGRFLAHADIHRRPVQRAADGRIATTKINVPSTFYKQEQERI